MTDGPSAPAAAAATASSSASATATAPPAAANKSAAYRSAAVDDAEDDGDDDDDDLDDLDDVLHSFNAPTSTLGKRAEPSRDAAAKPTRGAGGASDASAAAGAGAGAVSTAAPSLGGDIDDDEFQAQLMEGMESLLRSLAIDHPPGPMPGTTGSSPPKGAAAAAAGATAPGAPGDLSKEDEDKAFQRAVEMMLSGEGMEALGLDKPAAAAGAGAGAGPSTARSAGGAAGAPPKASFDETIRRTMDSLNAGGAGAASTEGMPGDLAALLRQLSEDPSALDALGGGGDDDDDLGGLLDGMMAQLMSKDVLEEPMTELAAKYPAYLESPPAGTKEADLVKYRQQHALVQEILEVFKRPQYSDDVDGKEVARLVGEMQDLGGPPTEIMGDLPEGFDMGALGGDEGCVVM